MITSFYFRTYYSIDRGGFLTEQNETVPINACADQRYSMCSQGGDHTRIPIRIIGYKNVI
jgi:hypothetical protein